MFVKIRIILSICTIIFFNACSDTHDVPTSIQTELMQKYAKTIIEQDLKKHLTIIASDDFEGRNTGYPGEQKAKDYILNFYKDLNVSTQQQAVPQDYIDKKPSIVKLIFKPKASHNIIASITGSEKPEEVIIISAHMDHLGIKKGTGLFGKKGLYNGADDNGSGTVALLEIAEGFQKAKQAGYPPKRTLVFIHFTAEEVGLIGSYYYVENPIYPLKSTLANINIDMIGHVDERHKGNPNYIYVIGSDRINPHLKQINEQVNQKFTKLSLDYFFDSESQKNKFKRSDHYPFHLQKIPVLFYHSGLHKWYHTPEDDVQYIAFPSLTKRTQLAFYVIWTIASTNENWFSK